VRKEIKFLKAPRYHVDIDNGKEQIITYTFRSRDSALIFEKLTEMDLKWDSKTK